MNSLQITLEEMSNILNISKEQVRRLTNYLDLPYYKPTKNSRIYKFNKDHPFYISYYLIYGIAKPIYSIQEIADLYQWRGNAYSTKNTITKLNEYNINIYNAGNKGYCYLSDIIKIGDEQNKNFPHNKREI